jgi:2-phosphoglycerate kinase
MSPVRRDDAPWLEEETIPTLVEHPSGARPFMPGILVHSLVLRGVPFAAAYSVATRVRSLFDGRSRISKRELSDAVNQILGYELPGEADASSEISIRGRGDGLPFSKGVLSQSLLATAIDPAKAFAVAREIEQRLVSSGVREIDRHELRELACGVLRDRMGVEIAERYLLWRRYQEPGRPVILLLGGTSGVGKSALALELARRLGIGRVQSTDAIRQMMRIMLSQELVPALYGSSYDAYRLLPREDGREPSVIDGFRAQAAAVTIGIRAALDRSVAETANLVIDGVSIVPGSIDVSAHEGQAHIIFLMIASLDEHSLRNRFVARATGQQRRMAHRYLENIEGILTIQRHLLVLAERHDVPVIDNADFETSVRQMISHVMETLRERTSLDAADAGQR